jgi:cardiolipin synthase
MSSDAMTPPLTKIELLVDSGEFWSRLKDDVARARERVYTQALSFEGDAAGNAMAEALLRCAAPDRRVLIDSFTFHVINDRFRWTPRNLLDRELRSEVRATGRMVEALREGGVGVRFTNPVGPFFTRFPNRNHKKLVVVDDRIAYVGGINFSDHNFAWHDLMLRIEDPAVAAFLGDDFASSWRGRQLGGHRVFPGVQVSVLDGASNEAAFAPVIELLDQARESVFVECPYLTSPFCGRLAAARRRGVAVTVVTPERNNWGLVRDAMVWQAQRHDLDVRFYPDRMTHMKALLVDGRSLVLGSANFDVWSYRFQQEFLAIVTDATVISDFTARVLEPDLARSAHCEATLGNLASRLLEWKLGAIETLSAHWKTWRRSHADLRDDLPGVVLERPRPLRQRRGLPGVRVRSRTEGNPRGRRRSRDPRPDDRQMPPLPGGPRTDPLASSAH